MQRTKDSMYSWIVASMVWAETFLMSASYGTYGVLFVELMDTYGASKAGLSIIGSLQNGMNFAGIVVGLLTKKYGHQPMGYLATVMVTGGFILAMFTTQFWLMYISIGILHGFGYAIIRVLIGVPIHKYFEKNKALAMALSTSGFPAGLLVWPLFFWFLIHQYALKGALLIMAGVQLHGFLFFMVMNDPDVPKANRALGLENLDENHQKEGIVCKPADENGFTVATGGNAESQSVVKHMDEANEHVILKPKEVPIYRQLGLHLFTEKSYTLWMLGFCVTYASSMIYTYIGPRAALSGASSKDSALLLTIFGIAALAARPLIGVIFDHITKSRNYVYGLAHILHGLVCVVSVVSNNYYFLACFAVASAFCTGLHKTLMLIVPVDLWGKDNAPMILGHTFFWSGIGSLAGFPLIGLLLDVLDDPGLTFVIMGCIQIVGGGMSFLAAWIRMKNLLT